MMTALILIKRHQYYTYLDVSKPATKDWKATYRQVEKRKRLHCNVINTPIACCEFSGPLYSHMGTDKHGLCAKTLAWLKSAYFSDTLGLSSGSLRCCCNGEHICPWSCQFLILLILFAFVFHFSRKHNCVSLLFLSNTMLPLTLLDKINDSLNCSIPVLERFFAPLVDVFSH